MFRVLSYEAPGAHLVRKGTQYIQPMQTDEFVRKNSGSSEAHSFSAESFWSDTGCFRKATRTRRNIWSPVSVKRRTRRCNAVVFLEAQHTWYDRTSGRNNYSKPIRHHIGEKYGSLVQLGVILYQSLNSWSRFNDVGLETRLLASQPMKQR